MCVPPGVPRREAPNRLIRGVVQPSLRRLDGTLDRLLRRVLGAQLHLLPRQKLQHVKHKLPVVVLPRVIEGSAGVGGCRKRGRVDRVSYIESFGEGHGKKEDGNRRGLLVAAREVQRRDGVVVQDRRRRLWKRSTEDGADQAPAPVVLTNIVERRSPYRVLVEQVCVR
jgi:hypothetical protein